MCGIAGFYSSTQKVSRDAFKHAVGTLSHRGPDAEGFYFLENADFSLGLGHRRLSIIDLSETANQPFFSSCGKYVIIFNGEVYNYKELAKELDVTLKSTSDTEVVLELFVKFGPEFVSKLNGMFAIAIYDIDRDVFFLYRDRLGVKPLYYFCDHESLFFASELKSLLSIEYLKRKLSVDRNAVNVFLHLGYIPEPLTIYQEVKKFPAGSYAVFSKGNISFINYWNPNKVLSTKTHTDFKEAKVALQQIIESSIQYRMISDVSFGTFLSGGIDSSLVTAIASRYAQEPLKTFSIGFEEKRFDESQYARKIASFLKTDHHELIVSQQEALDHFESVMDHFDEPFADTSALPTYLVSKLASKHVKMVLTGDGGDELFMGYGSYQWAERLSNPFYAAFKTPGSFLMRHWGNNRLKRASSLLEGHKGSVHSHIFSQEQYLFSQHEIDDLLVDNTADQFQYFISKDNPRKLSASEEQALFDLRFYLKDDLLVKVDRTSMLSSIEAREPLLDYRLVEFALNIPQQFKMNGGEHKIMLKSVLYDYLPKVFFDRPKKGFSIPLAVWMKRELRYLIDDYLTKSKIQEVGLFEYDYVKNIITRFDKGEDYLYNRLYAVSVLQKWFLNNR